MLRKDHNREVSESTGIFHPMSRHPVPLAKKQAQITGLVFMHVRSCNLMIRLNRDPEQGLSTDSHQNFP
jgi:hypothetical protein